MWWAEVAPTVCPPALLRSMSAPAHTCSPVHLFVLTPLIHAHPLVLASACLCPPLPMCTCPPLSPPICACPTCPYLAVLVPTQLSWFPLVWAACSYLFSLVPGCSCLSLFGCAGSHSSVCSCLLVCARLCWSPLPGHNSFGLHSCLFDLHSCLFAFIWPLFVLIHAGLAFVCAHLCLFDLHLCLFGLRSPSFRLFQALLCFGGSLCAPQPLFCACIKYIVSIYLLVK